MSQRWATNSLLASLKMSLNAAHACIHLAFHAAGDSQPAPPHVDTSCQLVTMLLRGVQVNSAEDLIQALVYPELDPSNAVVVDITGFVSNIDAVAWEQYAFDLNDSRSV